MEAGIDSKAFRCSGCRRRGTTFALVERLVSQASLTSQEASKAAYLHSEGSETPKTVTKVVMGLPVETLENGRLQDGTEQLEESSTLSGYKIDISHQEVERIIDELEEIYQNQPQEWLDVEAIGMLLCTTLGYEDMDEFEDAIKGVFAEFLEQLPHIELQSRESDNLLQFRIRPSPPPEAWRSKTITVNVSELSDLHRVCLKAAEATIEIPELEFEISPDRKNRIDTIYNHLGSAIFNLGSHVRMNPAMESDVANKIIDTVIALNVLLDVEKPWTFIVKDPTGFSDVKPLDGVQVQFLDG